MRKIFAIYFILTLFSFTNLAQDYLINKIRLGGPENYQETNSGSLIVGGTNYMAVNSQNEKFVIGKFKDSFTIQDQTVYGGENSVYLVKFDADDNIVWFKSIAHSVAEHNTYLYLSINADQFGSVYFSMFYTAPSIIFGTTRIPSNGAQYFAKMNQDGLLIYEKSYTRSCVNSVYARDFTFDAAGNLYITGIFGPPINNNALDNCELNPYFTNFDSYNIFIAKYDAIGNLQWAKNYFSQGSDRVYDLQYHNQKLYLAANLGSSNCHFLGATNCGFASLNDNNVILAQLDENGVTEWLSFIVTNDNSSWQSNDIHIKQLEIVDQDNILLLLDTYSVSANASVVFHNGPNISFNLEDIHSILVNYDSNGIVKWQETFLDTKKNVSVNSSNQIYALSSSDIDVVHIDGTFMWNSNFYDFFPMSWYSVSNIYALENGNIYLCGSLPSGAVDLGAMKFNLPNHSMFIARVSEEVYLSNEGNEILKEDIKISSNFDKIHISNSKAIHSLMVYDLNGNLLNKIENINHTHLELEKHSNAVVLFDFLFNDGTSLTKKYATF